MIATATDAAYETARAIRDAGGHIVAILDLRETSPAAEAARAEGFRVETGVTLLGTEGKKALKGVMFAPCVNGVRQGPSETISADCLLVSGGFTPTLHLLSQARGKLTWDDTLAAFVPGDLPEGITVAGLASGDFPPVMRGAALGLLPGNEDKLPRPSSISRTMSPCVTFALPRARASAPSST